LVRAYIKGLDTFTHEGLRWVLMIKRMFWKIFKQAWKASFMEKNIKRAFEKTGI
jgi:hypothetical protein